MKRHAMLRAVRCLALLVMALPLRPAEAQAVDKPADKPAEKPAASTALVIRGGDLYPIRGPIIRGGMLLIEDGKIKALGTQVDTPTGAHVLDATGKIVMPGLVAARLDGVLPNAAKKVADVLDPYSATVAFALASGITSAYVEAGSPNDAGLSTVNAVVKMTEGELKGMLVREPAAVRIAFSGRSPAQVAQLRLALTQAAAYLRNKAQYDRDKAAGKKVEEPKAPRDSDMMLRLLRGELPGRVTVSQANEVLRLASLANEFDLRLILENLVEGWTVASQVTSMAAGAVLTARVQQSPDRTLNAPTGSSDTQPAVLARAGVRLALVPPTSSFSTGGDFGEDLFMLPLEAAYAVGGGLDEQTALEAITINPAELLGVADRLGSLQVGKDADVIILDGHPLHYRSFVETTIVNGKVLYEKGKSSFFSHVGRTEKKPEGKADATKAEGQRK